MYVSFGPLDLLTLGFHWVIGLHRSPRTMLNRNDELTVRVDCATEDGQKTCIGVAVPTPDRLLTIGELKGQV